MTSLADIWPIFSLRLSTPRLELRPLRDEDIARYVDAALSGIHAPEVMPFSYPWTDASPEDLARNTAEHIWRTRLASRPGDWTIAFGIWYEGELVGCQDMAAKSFAVLRTVTTGSWLKQAVQGQGLGREMRTAVALYAFDHLGALAADSDAASWNAASLGVSSHTGYVPNGTYLSEARPGETVQMQRLLLTPQTFRRPDWTLEVEGHDAVARFLELPSTQPTTPATTPAAEEGRAARPPLPPAAP